MAPRKKIPRLSGIRKKTVYRDSVGRFAKRDDSVSEETWSYRVDAKQHIKDLKIDSLPFYEFETQWQRSIPVAQSGVRAGKLSGALKQSLRQIPVSRADMKIDISMTAKTYHGKIVKRKLSFYHYNSKKLDEHTIGGILNSMFYEYGDRPAYPVKIVKGWRKRHTTKKETEKRRQLYNVRFSVRSEVVSKESETAKPRKRKRRERNEKN